MSGTQSHLGDWHTPDPEPPEQDEDGDWKRLDDHGAAYKGALGRERIDDNPEPQTDCQYCGGHVRPDYVRVMGIQGKVYACPNCADKSGLHEAAADRSRVRE